MWEMGAVVGNAGETDRDEAKGLEERQQAGVRHLVLGRQMQYSASVISREKRVNTKEWSTELWSIISRFGVRCRASPYAAYDHATRTPREGSILEGECEVTLGLTDIQICAKLVREDSLFVPVMLELLVKYGLSSKPPESSRMLYSATFAFDPATRNDLMRRIGQEPCQRRIAVSLPGQERRKTSAVTGVMDVRRRGACVCLGIWFRFDHGIRPAEAANIAEAGLWDAARAIGLRPPPAPWVVHK
jgi:hypothetical protein